MSRKWKYEAPTPLHRAGRLYHDKLDDYRQLHGHMPPDDEMRQMEYDAEVEAGLNPPPLTKKEEYIKLLPSECPGLNIMAEDDPRHLAMRIFCEKTAAYFKKHGKRVSGDETIRLMKEADLEAGIPWEE